MESTAYALGWTTIDLSLSLFPWTLSSATKAAVKMHKLLELRCCILSFIHFSDGKLHDVLVPEAGVIFRFRHLLEKHGLAVAIFAEVSVVLSEKWLSMKRSTVADVTLIAAPSATKSEDMNRDPAMTQSMEGDRWRFGMKAHIGVDAESGPVHTVECTMAKVADITLSRGAPFVFVEMLSKQAGPPLPICAGKGTSLWAIMAVT